MPYVAPATVVSGTTITTAWGNAVKTGLDYQANAPCCRVTHNAAQSITDAAEITVAFNVEVFDPAGMHSTVTNNSRITFNDAGVYVVTFGGELVAAADYTLITVRFVANGTTNIARAAIGTVANATQTPGLHLATIYKFAAGEWVDVRVLQDNTASAARNLLASTGLSPMFSAAWVGLG